MSEHDISDAEREPPQDLSNPQVAEKCKVAADIANAALRFVGQTLNPGRICFLERSIVFVV